MDVTDPVSQEKVGQEKSGKNACKVSKIFYVDLNISKTVLWLLLRRRVGRQRRIGILKHFSELRAGRRKKRSISVRKRPGKSQEISKTRSCDNPGLFSALLAIDLGYNSLMFFLYIYLLIRLFSSKDCLFSVVFNNNIQVSYGNSF